MMISMAHDLLYQIYFEKKVNKIKSINTRFLIYRFLICALFYIMNEAVIFYISLRNDNTTYISYFIFNKKIDNFKTKLKELENFRNIDELKVAEDFKLHE